MKGYLLPFRFGGLESIVRPLIEVHCEARLETLLPLKHMTSGDSIQLIFEEVKKKTVTELPYSHVSATCNQSCVFSRLQFTVSRYQLSQHQ